MEIFPPLLSDLMKGGERMEAFTKVLELFQVGVGAYGVWMLVQGLITAAGGISNHQSTEMRDGGAKVIGGAMIIAGAVIIGTIKIG